MLTKQKLRIRLKSFNHKLLTESCDKIIQNLQAVQAEAIGPIPLPVNKRIYCILRSPHVDKDSREHFEIRIHKRVLDISYDPSINMFDILSKSDLPPGILYRICLS